MRKALDLLALDGMIQKIHGKGSLVIYQEVTEFPFSELVSFKEMQEEMGVADIGNDVASDSIYDYLEKVLNLNISYSSKSITFEPFDEQAYQLFGDVSVAYSATVRSIVYLENTMPFQYNISKHLANEFKFNDFSRRRTK
ncbi:trehalose operon transcriptional repressor [Staphylococcus aureus]|nr:trehalose operon transcriptional repressor [Staphylococcus aureus]